MNHNALLLVCVGVAGVLVAMPRLRKVLLVVAAVAVVALVVLHHLPAGGAR